jgi:hypothetical protein
MPKHATAAAVSAHVPGSGTAAGSFGPGGFGLGGLGFEGMLLGVLEGVLLGVLPIELSTVPSTRRNPIEDPVGSSTARSVIE